MSSRKHVRIKWEGKKMKMRAQFIITKCNHYDMGDNRGLSVRVVGDKQVTNNSFGQEISEATIPNYEELKYLKQYADNLPAKFEADFALTALKASNGKEKTGVALSNLKYLNSVEFTDVKEPAAVK
jgi:hypothetical protein